MSERLHKMLDLAVQYQDRKYGPFTPDVPGVRLALAVMRDETKEALDAWREERDPKPGTKAWALTAEETMQVAAICFRLLRDMGVGSGE